MSSRSTWYSPSLPITWSRKNAASSFEFLAYDLVVGVHPASEISNLKKGVNTYIRINETEHK